MIIIQVNLKYDILFVLILYIVFFLKNSLNLYELYMLYTYQEAMIHSSTASNECVTKFHSTGCKCAAKNVLCTINLPQETDREYDRGTVD